MTVALRSGRWFWDSQAAGPGAVHRAGTVMQVANVDADGTDQQALLEGLLPGDVMHLDAVDDPDGWWAYTVTEAPAASPPPADMTSVKITSGGHGTTANPSDGATLLVTFMLMAAPAPPVPPPSLAAQAVADYLGVPYPDDRMELCAVAAQGFVETRRCLTEPAVLWADASVVLGAVMYAALLYQQRGQPQGFPGMDALGTYSEDTGMAMSQVYRLVGADVVVA